MPLTAGNDDALTVILRQRGLNFAARRRMVVFKQWLCAAEGDRRAHERDVVRRIHAQAPVRAARDEKHGLPHRPA